MNLPDLPLAIEAALLAQDDTWDDSVIHATDLAVYFTGDDGKCPRELWLRLHGAKQRGLHRGELLMFDHGNEIHERTTKLLNAGFEALGEQWEVYRVEHPVEYEGVTGRYDVMLRNSFNELVIVDYKTSRGRAFQYMDSPRPSNELQLQFYLLAADADAGLILYIDREGQNYMRAYRVDRDDLRVEEAIECAGMIAGLPEPPEILKPRIKVNENKGLNSINVSQPWQCDWCRFCDIACPGALPPDYRVKGIVGHIDEGRFLPKAGMEHMVEVLPFEEGA